MWNGTRGRTYVVVMTVVGLVGWLMLGLPAASNAASVTPNEAAAAPAAGQVTPLSEDAYQPLSPARLADTRPGNATVDGQGPKGAVAGGTSIDVATLGRAGLPASGVGAVALNVTVTQPSAQGWITVWPAGQPRPLASNLNYTPGRTVPNMVIARVGAGGRVSLYNNTGTTHLIVDIMGWYPTTSDFVSLSPARLADTRPGNATVDGQGPKGAVAGGTSIDVATLGRAGLPASGVGAVALNVTVTQPSAQGWITVWPTGQPRPLASNLNYTAGLTVPNMVIARVGTDGNISLYNNTGTTHLIVDIMGWYPTNSDFAPMTSARLADTRLGNPTVDGQGPKGVVAGGTSIDVSTLGRAGLPGAGVGAVVLNVTVTQPSAQGWITVWPTGQPRPLASNLNYTPGRTVPNMVIARVGAGGKVSLYNNTGSTHLIVDIMGWYPTQPFADASTIAAANGHTCAIVAGGQVKCWGLNTYGQLGDGTTTYRTAPVAVPGIVNAVALAAGFGHTCAVLQNGQVKCWGLNRYGQLGDGTQTNRAAPVTVSDVANATRVSSNGEHTCALLSDGQVACWGYNVSGQLGDGTYTSYRTVPVLAKQIANATAVSAGGSHTCALIAGGEVKCWGSSFYGQVGAGTTGTHYVPASVLTGARSVSAGGLHTCAILLDGQARCWGHGGYAALGDGTTNDRAAPTAVSGLTGGVSIAAGNRHTCAVLSTGQIKCWGMNDMGQLGVGSFGGGVGLTPVPVTFLAGGTAVAVGSYHSCALVGSGKTLCWGINSSGELGDATRAARAIAGPVMGL